MSKATELAKKQREVGVAEFFARNKHLLGFDNSRKSLLTTVKEAVDNSLDACEDADILPEISIEIIDMTNDRYRVIIEDNGPGIVKNQIGKIFAKLLYGSKFHSRRQQRGQQGIGISAAVMYGQMTTGRPARILTKWAEKKPAHYMELTIDTKKNIPKILKDEEREWPEKETGTRIEIDLEANYMKGQQSVDEYIKETAVVNPHATLIYTNPRAEQYVFARVTQELPQKAEEIQPHPHGIEIGELLDMLHDTQKTTLSAFLQNDFTRVSSNIAKEICANARLETSLTPQDMKRDQAEQLMKGIKETKVMAPPTDCLSPIGSDLLEKGLKKEIQAEFYTSTTREATVVKGNPLQVEVALAFGGKQDRDGAARLMRFANRVPLLYQAGGCAITKAVQETNWKAYQLQQSSGSLPQGPITIVVHIASVWVPFTSESKEAIANYDEIIKEVKLGVQEAGRDLKSYVKKKYNAHRALERANLFERYIPEVADSLARLTDGDKKKLEKALLDMTQKEEIQQDVESMKADTSEYDEEFAQIGKEEMGLDDEIQKHPDEE